MPMLAPPNTTCDVYRTGVSPPTAPSVAGVDCLLKGIYPQGLERGEGDPLALKYTHMMLVDAATDIRDDYDVGTISGNQDTVYVPDSSGTAFAVVFTEIVDLGTAWEHKRIFLVRLGPSYPTDEL